MWIGLNTTIHLQHFRQRIRSGFIAVLIATLVSCSGGGKRIQSAIEYEPVESKPTPVETPITNNIPDDKSLVQPRELIQPVESSLTQPTARKEMKNEAGWIITERSMDVVNAIERKAESVGVTHVQFGGNVLTAMDDLILDDNVREFVTQAAKQLEARNIETLVWSRELNLEGESFRFNLSAPLVAARQAAYRTALTNIPELDGVVLVFSGARLEPWNVTIPDGVPSPSVPDRLRFIIDIVKSVVVDELDKQLLILADADTLEQLNWIVSAIESYRDEMNVIVPITLFKGALVGPQNPVIDRLSKHHLLVEYDLTGNQTGGPDSLTLCCDELARRRESVQSLNIIGGVGTIQIGNRMLFDTPLELNLSALSKIETGGLIDMEPLWAEWVEKRYGLLPMSREGQILLRIMRSSLDWTRKMVFAKNLVPILPYGSFPDKGTVSLWSFDDRYFSFDKGYQYQIDELSSPSKQTMQDLAQESYEAMNRLDSAIENLQSIRDYLRPVDFKDLENRLTYQKHNADILFYAKQAHWGFLLWKQTMDEDEALCLEAHLQRLEELATISDINLGEGVSPIDPDRIRTFIADIRSQFPHVILGARERTWNRLSAFTILQTGPNSIEVRWTSERPSTSRLFVTTQLPIFEIMKPCSLMPATEHTIVLDGLKPGTVYHIKLQCTAGSGEVTNSGDFLFRLESPSFL